MSADDCPNIPAPVIHSRATEMPEDNSKERKNQSNRPWKVVRANATARTQSVGNKSRNWDTRMKQKRDVDATKAIQREMIEEKEVEEARKREITQSRKKTLAEKKRLEELATKMSAKRLQRARKRLDRTKKISG